MKVLTLDDKEPTWKIKGKKNSHSQRSKLHLAARELLHDLFPTTILEEVTIEVVGGIKLYLDFYIPLHKMCIEVHGEQHFQFVPFFHKNILDMMKQRKNDMLKVSWCLKNNIEYYSLPFNENIDEWRAKFVKEQD